MKCTMLFFTNYEKCEKMAMWKKALKVTESLKVKRGDILGTFTQQWKKKKEDSKDSQFIYIYIFIGK